MVQNPACPVTLADTAPVEPLVLRANAVTSCAYVISVNRPGPVPGVDMGGPSLAIAPDGATAWVSLQENNAFAEVDLVRRRIARINEIDPAGWDGRDLFAHEAQHVIGAAQPIIAGAEEQARVENG